MLTWLTRYLNLSVSWATLCNQVCSNQLLSPILSVPLPSVFFSVCLPSFTSTRFFLSGWSSRSMYVSLFVQFLNGIHHLAPSKKSRGRELITDLFHDEQVLSSFLPFSPILRRSLFLGRRCVRVSLYAVASVTLASIRVISIHPFTPSFKGLEANPNKEQMFIFHPFLYLFACFCHPYTANHGYTSSSSSFASVTSCTPPTHFSLSCTSSIVFLFL